MGDRHARQVKDDFIEDIINGRDTQFMEEMPRFGKCTKCDKIKRITRHSLSGGHKPPYILLCRYCHDIAERPKIEAQRIKQIEEAR